MKINDESQRIILHALEERGKLTVPEATELLGISEATVRRLFVKLGDKGLATRVFGGIQPIRSDGIGYSFNTSSFLRTKEKMAIGKLAALEVVSGDNVFLDSGTTVLAMAQALALRYQKDQLDNVKILTNSLNLADTLSPLCKVVLLGGEIRPERRDACGFLAEEMLKRLHVKKAFLGCDALNLERGGLMTTDERTARMNEIIIGNAACVYILADASKIGETSFVSYGSLDQVDICIIDSTLSPEKRELLASRVKSLVIAE